MAGRGPAPKANRQRRNEPARGEWVDLPPLDAPVLDTLPPGEWREETREVWESWRNDPVTSQWTPADITYALDTIKLRDEGVERKASEVRLRMDALGLTPKGKKDLRWRVKGDAEVVEHPTKKRERSLRAV